MARIATKQLAALCRRLGLALESGIDERRVWQREADRAKGSARKAINQISQAVNSGEGAGEGMSQTGRFFPPLFHQLVQLGERTGKSAAVFRRLADHYEHRVKLRRIFLAGITWPLIQLTAAVVIVGCLIWVLGMIGKQTDGSPYDILGLGLQGDSGLLIYVTIVSCAVAVGFGAYFLLRSGAVWTRPVQLAVIYLPRVGPCVKTLCLSRLSWSLGLSLEAGMDVRRAVPFALQSAGSPYFSRHVPEVSAALQRGEDLFSALAPTGAFPDEFLDAIQVGEQSGRSDESMLRLADQYQDQAKSALATLAILAGFAVWAFVAMMIIAIIFSIVSSYTNMLMDLSKPR